MWMTFCALSACGPAARQASAETAGSDAPPPATSASLAPFREARFLPREGEAAIVRAPDGSPWAQVWVPLDHPFVRGGHGALCGLAHADAELPNVATFVVPRMALLRYLGFDGQALELCGTRYDLSGDGVELLVPRSSDETGPFDRVAMREQYDTGPGATVSTGSLDVHVPLDAMLPVVIVRYVAQADREGCVDADHGVLRVATTELHVPVTQRRTNTVDPTVQDTWFELSLDELQTLLVAHAPIAWSYCRERSEISHGGLQALAEAFAVAELMRPAWRDRPLSLYPVPDAVRESALQ